MILRINYSNKTREPMQRKHFCIVMRVGSIKLIVSFAKLIQIITNKFWETVLATPWSCYSYFCQKIILMEITYKKVFTPQTLAKLTCPTRCFTIHHRGLSKTLLYSCVWSLLGLSFCVLVFRTCSKILSGLNDLLNVCMYAFRVKNKPKAQVLAIKILQNGDLSTIRHFFYAG